MRWYEDERAESEVGAHIKTFLSIFAIRNVQEILRERSAAPCVAGKSGVLD